MPNPASPVMKTICRDDSRAILEPGVQLLELRVRGPPCRRVRARFGGSERFARGGEEPVAAAVQRLNEARLVHRVVQGLADFQYGALQDAFGDVNVGPDGVQQFLFGDQPAGPLRRDRAARKRPWGTSEIWSVPRHRHWLTSIQPEVTRTAVSSASLNRHPFPHRRITTRTGIHPILYLSATDWKPI